MAYLSQPRLPLLRGLAGGYKGAGTGPRLPEPKAVSPRRDERPAFSWCLTLSLSSLLWWLLLDGIGRVPSLGLHGFSVVLNLATMIVLMFLAGLTLATALWVAEQLLADRKGYRSGTATLVVLYVLVDYVFVMYFRRLMGQPESIPFEKTRALYPVLFLLGLLLYRIRFKDELEWLRVQARAYTGRALRWLIGLLVAALLVLLGAAVHTALAPAMKIPQTLPHIVVITSDSMRSRNLSLYGYWRQTTPRLDTLAQNSYVFNRFRTNYASTRFAMPAFLGYCATLDRCDVNLIDSLRRMGYKRASMIAFSSIAPQVRDSFDRVLVTQDQVNHPLMKAVRAYIDVDAANWLVGFISEPSFAYNLLSTYNPVYVDNRKRIPPQQALAIALELLSQAHEPELVWVHLYQPHWPYDVSNRPLFGNPAISR